MPEEQEVVAEYLPQLNEAVAELITRSAIHALVGIHYHAHRRTSEFV